MIKLETICINHLTQANGHCANCSGQVYDCDKYKPQSSTQVPVRRGLNAYRSGVYKR
jgi:hypothetical protein